MPIRVKICGMTNVQDVTAARAAGANLVGFIFAESPRKVDVATVRKITDHLDAVEGVAVVRGLSVDEVFRLREAAFLRWVQFHGNEPPEVVNPFAPWVLRVFDRFGPEERALLPKFPGAAFLLDRPKAGPPELPEGRRGDGSGQGPDTAFAEEAKKYGPVLIAGKLDPDNVADAIRRYRPHGVDACSGLESAPGKKDHGKLRAFLQAVRAVEKELGLA